MDSTARAVCIIITRNSHVHILPRAGPGRVYVRTYHLQTIPVSACVQAYTYTWNFTYACVHVYTYTCNISPLVEKRSRKLRDDQKFAFSVISGVVRGGARGAIVPPFFKNNVIKTFVIDVR